MSLRNYTEQDLNDIQTNKQSKYNTLYSNNYFYSGSALGLKNIIKKSGLSIGGNKEIKIQKFYGYKRTITRKKIPNNSPLIILI